jgi:hypothetical protein
MAVRKPFWLLMLTFTYACVESICFVGLLVLDRDKNAAVAVRPRFQLPETTRDHIHLIVNPQGMYYQLSPTLGWTVRPGARALLYRANSQGIRGDEDYTPTVPGGVIRIAAFGDSFVHGNEVTNSHTWPAILDRRDPRLEVLNFGVGAYGLDQAYLRYEHDGARFHPHVVMIGFMSENIHRSVNTFRPFYTPQESNPRSKPRFLLDGDDLVLLENPLSTRTDYRELVEHEHSVIESLGEHDFYYQARYGPGRLFFLPSARLLYFVRNLFSRDRIIVDDSYNPRSEAFQVTTRLFVRFYDAALERDSLPIVVVFPDRRDLRRFGESRSKVYEPLLEFFRGEGLRYVDVLRCFGDAAPRPIEFLKGGHYAPSTNGIVADCLRDHLGGWRLFELSEVERTVAHERRMRIGSKG